ncbi:MAG: sensor domain-containing diguanylate cyclase [Candidatus Omnitrophica bacterium]|nr:sensor domain-containing diguanylate cyclase [Candidatus Omnitrophota bacterium]
MNDQPLENQNMPSNNELTRARRELSVVYEISNAMRTTLDLDHILYIILTSVTSHTGLGFNRAILFLENKIERCLEPRMAIGPESLEDAQKIWEYISDHNQALDDLIDKEKLDQNISQGVLFKSVEKLKIPFNSSEDNLLITAYRNGVPSHIPKEKISQYANDPLLQTFKTNELVIMPLKAKDQVNGLIIADNLYTRKPITENDLKMFAMLANQAGLAIENSRLYELIKYKSHTDAITRLWNHGFFQDKLTKEIEKANTTHQMVSLIMIDIDNFKELNDMYGHQNGDIVLKEMANILRDSSRDGDYACRYGGEEFSVILTQTSKDQGYIIAERIRQKIEDYCFPKFSSEEQLKVTVSIGLATFPENAQRKESLITETDKAMYCAKFSGKNQTCVA